jgi:peptide-methionine (R)-S-oxide reductase
MTHEVEHTEQEWRRVLSPEQFRVLRQAGTEPPFANAYCDEHGEGVYRCGACGAELFRAADKYDSGTGWPSFVRAASDDAVETVEDRAGGMLRTEVRCATCGSHLGHVFQDGPAPTGQRFCMNSAALGFEPRE